LKKQYRKQNDPQKIFKLAFHSRILYGQLTPHPPPGYSSVHNAPCQPRDKVTGHTSVAMLISKIKFEPSNREFNLESETTAIGLIDTVTPKLKQGSLKDSFLNAKTGTYIEN
jgi:hypothetical protein